MVGKTVVGSHMLKEIFVSGLGNRVWKVTSTEIMSLMFGALTSDYGAL